MHHIGEVPAVQCSSHGVANGKHNPNLIKGMLGRHRELQASQSHLSDWQNLGAPGNCAKVGGK